MPRAPKKISDDECMEVVQAILMKTIRDKKTTDKERRSAGDQLLKLLTIKNKIKGPEDDGHFFSNKP